MAAIMKTSLFPSLFIFATAAFGLVSTNPEVKMKNFTYPCCTGATIWFDHNCDNLLSSNDMPFAMYKKHGLDQGCIAPCKEIHAGEMVLEKCVEVQLSEVCKTGMNKVYEKKTTFTNVPCSGSSLAPGCVGLLLLILVFMGPLDFLIQL